MAEFAVAVLAAPQVLPSDVPSSEAVRLLLALLSDLRLIARASAAQLDPVHEPDRRFFERDRGCWKAGLRSAGFTNAYCWRPSAPLRKVIANPLKRGARDAPRSM
jgi:hypothetical protein